MNDKIFIDDIEIFGKHGVAQHEKRDKQRFLVSICAQFDAMGPKVSDDISTTVDYAKLLATVIAVVENSSFNLIERLAQEIADTVLAQFPPILSLEVSIKKFPKDLAGEKFLGIGFSSVFLRNEK
jgi:dihydroneopterin aldolase